MPPKQDKKKDAGKSKKDKDPVNKSGGKAKKKKWSKGKVRDKLNNLVLFDKATYDKLYKEVPNYKLITPAVVSERLKIRGSLARNALQELLAKGMIKLVVEMRRQQQQRKHDQVLLHVSCELFVMNDPRLKSQIRRPPLMVMFKCLEDTVRVGAPSLGDHPGYFSQLWTHGTQLLSG
ncbi:hypothetical protein ILYODFUR_006354 [Ilyodon furcidens]|uniref:40S ribosomal protein S25 n=1 Tax=Ilyodon furcidens TaxID=33524 RepID=A0ABV0VC36_9TELE